MDRRTVLALLFLALLLPVATEAKKPEGQISNLAAFAKIRSYCVDSSGLPGDEANDLKNFITVESKPKKLLTKLPWTAMSDCSHDPDAVVTVEFHTYNILDENQVVPHPPGTTDQSEMATKTIRVILRVSQGTSSDALYEIKSAPLDASVSVPGERHNGLYNAFWQLIQDVQRVSQTIAK